MILIPNLGILQTNAHRSDSLVHRLFEKISTDNSLLGRCINSFSYLEYLGARSLESSFANDKLCSQKMLHILEENRHAFLLRMLSQYFDISVNSYSPKDTLNRDAFNTYFLCSIGYVHRNLTARTIQIKNLTTALYCTILFELRAISLYSTIELCSQKIKQMKILNSILRDESIHLNNTLAELNTIDHHGLEKLEKFSEVENKNFTTLILRLLK